ncbi:hypothetical protein Y043_6039 [Burkholderia pseudomallei MSHR2138]|nr:hypothetical protein Y043_6039 [Burkholderia pseudomallei MSHR2138]
MKRCANIVWLAIALRFKRIVIKPDDERSPSVIAQGNCSLDDLLLAGGSGWIYPCLDLDREALLRSFDQLLDPLTIHLCHCNWPPGT